MINIKHELIREKLPVIGSDAFTVIMAILSHTGKGKVAWPGIDRLCNMCRVDRNGEMRPMPKKRMHRAINMLIREGLAERYQERKKNGDFGLRKFKISSDLLGVTMFGDHEFEMDCGARLVENGVAPNGVAINDQTEELPKREDIVQKKGFAQEMFDTFWESFANKKNKKKARTAFNRLSKAKMSLCVDRIPEYKKYLELTGVIQMHPTTWINGERWEDDFTVQERNMGANTNEALNDKLLPEPLSSDYQKYIAYVIDTFPALWKSKCQALSKAQWYELTQTEVFPNLCIAVTARKAKDIRAKMHHLFNDNNFERAKYSTIYEAIKDEYRRHINHQKTLIA